MGSLKFEEKKNYLENYPVRIIDNLFLHRFLNFIEINMICVKIVWSSASVHEVTEY